MLSRYCNISIILMKKPDENIKFYTSTYHRSTETMRTNLGAKILERGDER